MVAWNKAALPQPCLQILTRHHPPVGELLLRAGASILGFIGPPWNRHTTGKELPVLLRDKRSEGRLCGYLWLFVPFFLQRQAILICLLLEHTYPGKPTCKLSSYPFQPN